MSRSKIERNELVPKDKYCIRCRQIIGSKKYRTFTFNNDVLYLHEFCYLESKFKNHIISKRQDQVPKERFLSGVEGIYNHLGLKINRGQFNGKF